MALARRKHRRRARQELPVPGQEHREHAQEPTHGPWDVVDAPDDARERIDLGALRVPALPGYDLRVEVSPEGQVVAATLASPRGEMQLGVFAAPRSAGIWDEVRAEIKATVGSEGGSITEQTGDFGPELAGRVPMPNGHAAARFLGIDGPRWFLRALLLGPVATDPEQAKPLEEALRDVIVVRGNDPMPVREPLPLRLPKDVAEQIAAQGDPSFLEQHEDSE
jgi:hypothetical protein